MKIKFTILLLLISYTLFAQGINNLWLMGYDSYAGRPFGGINLDFKSGSLDTSYQSRKMNFEDTNGEICDKNGNLLFYSNGIWIANLNNDTMENGSGLNPCLFTNENSYYGLPVPQGNLIIPFSNDSSKYYLFHITKDAYGQGAQCALYLYYSVIDMSGDSRRGSVIDKNHVLLNDSLMCGMITACKHANGRDWWLIAHQYHSARFYKYLITPDSIQGPSIQDIGTIRTNDVALGQSCFSPDGNKFGNYIPLYAPNPHLNYLDIFDFDRCSGNFSNPITISINDSAGGGGLAFSPNSKVLYVSSGYHVYQFDVTTGNIAASQTTVAIWDSTYSPEYPFAVDFYFSQLAPDGKIYINSGNGTDKMHVINTPDSLSYSCNFCQHCIQLPAINAFTIPNHPNYFLGAETGSVCDSLTTGLSPSPLERVGVRLFPNPVINDDVTFTYNVSPVAGFISIYNIEGEEVAHYRLPQWSSVQHLKLPALASGLYLARLTQGDAFSEVKFVKE